MTDASAAAEELLPLYEASKPTTAPKRSGPAPLNPHETLPISTTGSSASAAFARSLFLFMGLMYRRPSKLFRPSRVDTWGGLRQLALSADQTLSPSFIRHLIRSKSGALALTLTILPPLIVNTTLGFLLFTSHSFFALSLARLPFFRHVREPQSQLDGPTALVLDPTEEAEIEEEEEEDPINLHTLIAGPTVIPRHPTLLSAIAGGGAGLVQGLAFTPIENVVRLLQQSATSLTSLLVRFLRLPLPNLPAVSLESIPSSPLEALRNFLSSETWRRNPSWWSGWRWTVARDALSYSVFFAAFDITRRLGLRAKAYFGGSATYRYHDMLAFTLPESEQKDEDAKPTPTIARVAQATTIVAGGVMASLAAEMAGRPFRACQRIMIKAKTQGLPLRPHPVIQTWRTKGYRPFIQSDDPATIAKQDIVTTQSRLNRAMRRVGWRLAAVGPWGFGFLVWAWVGGEV